ncbi:hypothetical protein [Thiohalophilus sp.]|uniref:hypothetical protein n=1 Tax=Thiohalophilus sp. TaxID=3028392 RepID=UPI00397486F0
MKFSLLAVGQQFDYEGERYIKSTPLIAHQVDTGEQRLIPRSANVVSTDTPAVAPTPANTRIEADQLQAAFAELEHALHQQLGEEARFVLAFEQARQRFFERLGLTAAVSPRPKDHSSS